MTSEWVEQPIETAPKDGRLVLLYNGDIFMLGFYHPQRGHWIEWGSSGKPIDIYRPLKSWWALPTPAKDNNDQ
jgi:hypothetical protein